MAVFCLDRQVIISPRKKTKTKEALFVRMLVFQNNLLFRLVWTIICHLRIEKKIFPFWEHFKQTLSKYIPAENKIRENKNSEDFLLHQASIFRPKLGKFLWRIWKIKSSASSLNLCSPNQPTQVTNLSWNMPALEFTEAEVFTEVQPWELFYKKSCS